jgi:hypothetical protein
MRIVLSVAISLLVALAAAPDVEALCTCGTFGNCSSAIACDGKLPGAACKPPRRATCKVVQGNINLITCCCGCSRGRGLLSCLYTPVADDLVALDDAVCDSGAAVASTPAGNAKGCFCPSTKLARRARKTRKKAASKLRRADKQCNKGKDVRKHVKAATDNLNGLDRFVDRLLKKDEITPTCATGLKGLIDQFGVRIADAGQGGGTNVTTTTTTPGGTTTTMAAGPTCNPTFHTAPGLPNEYDFQFTCTGGNEPLKGFGIKVSAGFQLTDKIDPTDFTCQIQTQQNPQDWLWCTGDFNFGQAITGGRIHTTPAPTGPGFAATLSAVDGATYGPFDFTVQ